MIIVAAGKIVTADLSLKYILTAVGTNETSLEMNGWLHTVISLQFYSCHLCLKWEFTKNIVFVLGNFQMSLP